MAFPAAAQDFVDSSGPLTDEAFYRLVACAAPPEAECAKPFYRWTKTNITVGITQSDAAFLGGKIKRAEASVVRAIQRLNAVGMGITLSAKEIAPDITIHLLDIARGQKIGGSTAPQLNGLSMANAITALDVEDGTITGAAIGFSSTMTRRQYEPVVLEEITQALGLLGVQSRHLVDRV